MPNLPAAVPLPMNITLDWPQEILALQRRVYSVPWLSHLRAADFEEPWIDGKRVGKTLSDEYHRLLEDHAPYCNLPRWLEMTEKNTLDPAPAHVYAFDLQTRGVLPMLCRKVSPLWNVTMISPDTRIASEELLKEFGVKLYTEHFEEVSVDFAEDAQQIFLLLGCLERLEGGIYGYLQALAEIAKPGAALFVCTLNGEYQASYNLKTTAYDDCSSQPDLNSFQVTYAMNKAEATEVLEGAGWKVDKFAYGANVTAEKNTEQVPHYLNFAAIRQ